MPGLPLAPRGFRGLLLSLPALWLGVLIYRYGVDSPWWDQWDGMAQLFEKDEAGTLGYGDFFAFHNEHRIFFPRLLAFALAQLTHWNICAELVLIWLLLCGCALNIWRLACVTGWRDARERHWLLLGANVLLFTPLQWENLLWGFQIGFLFPIWTMTAAILVATAARLRLAFVGALALCVVTTFSIASGLGSFLLVGPLLAFREGKPRDWRAKMGWAIWIAVALVSAAIYFHGFVRPGGHPSETYAFAHPVQALQYLLAYLGSAFAPGIFLKHSVAAQIVGAVLILLLLVCVGCLWRRRWEEGLFLRAAPWFSLAGIALMTATLTMVGRVGFGISSAMSPRYVSFAIMLPIGLLFLSAALLRDRKLRAAALGLTSVLGVLFLGSTLQCLKLWPRLQHQRLTGKSVLVLGNVLDEPEAWKRSLHPTGIALRPRAAALDRLGYLRPPLIRSRDLREIAASGSETSMGELKGVRQTSAGEFAAHGWAILPARHRIADSVLLAYEGDGGEWMLFARADVGLPVAAGKQPREAAYALAGWSKSWKRADLPEAARRISAWAFDAEAGRAYFLGASAL